MSWPHRLFAQKRETVEEDFPGDLIGVTNPGVFAVGDTVTAGSKLQFAPIPPFQPEMFGLLRKIHVEASRRSRQLCNGSPSARRALCQQACYVAALLEDQGVDRFQLRL